MIFLVEGSYATSINWLATGIAQTTTLQVIVELTVGHVLVLIEARRIKSYPTFHADKTTGMEICVQCRYEVLNNWLDTPLTLGSQIRYVTVPF